jgi:hypothetical protein
VPPYLTRFRAGSSITEYLFCRLGNAYSLRFMKRKNSCSNECPSNKPPSAEVLQKTLAQIQEQLASTETLLQQRTNETNYYIQVRSDDRHLRKHFVRLLATVLSSPSCIRGYAPRPPPAKPPPTAGRALERMREGRRMVKRLPPPGPPPAPPAVGRMRDGRATDARTRDMRRAAADMPPSSPNPPPAAAAWNAFAPSAEAAAAMSLRPARWERRPRYSASPPPPPLLLTRSSCCRGGGPVS